MHLPEDALLKNLYWRKVWHRPLCEAIVLKNGAAANDERGWHSLPQKTRQALPTRR
jgi:hypothetical protein